MGNPWSCPQLACKDKFEYFQSTLDSMTLVLQQEFVQNGKHFNLLNFLIFMNNIGNNVFGKFIQVLNWFLVN